MIHVTSDNRKIAIACLPDTHLFNIIKLPFKKYTTDEISSWVVGKSVKITPEAFNNIIANNSFYIIEALRRDSLRESVLNLLANYNPVYASRSVFVINTDNFLESGNKIFESKVHTFDSTSSDDEVDENECDDLYEPSSCWTNEWNDYVCSH